MAVNKDLELQGQDKSKNINESSELLNLNDKKIIKKVELRRIEISELPNKLPDFKNSTSTKDSLLSGWLINWIENGLKSGKLAKNILLPKKSALASYLGVSIGTVQTAIRFVEDKGYVESKQRIGTFISDVNNQNRELRKQTSKREQAVCALKKIILNNKYSIGTPLPSSRELAKAIGSAPNTTRLALEFLAGTGIIQPKDINSSKSSWVLKELPKMEVESERLNLESDTLVDKVERDLKDLIIKRFKVSDKLPSHFELAEILKVSIKTVHDAMKRLTAQGILSSKRGRYGTSIMRIPTQALKDIAIEDSIFATATEASFYNYEKVEQHLKHLVKEEYKINDKLPSMGKLASQLKVSSNTIRKALQKLSEQNIVKFSRGRYGGTFVIGMPKIEETAKFTWLSINPEHAALYLSKK